MSRSNGSDLYSKLVNDSNSNSFRFAKGDYLLMADESIGRSGRGRSRSSSGRSRFSKRFRRDPDDTDDTNELDDVISNVNDVVSSVHDGMQNGSGGGSPAYLDSEDGEIRDPTVLGQLENSEGIRGANGTLQSYYNCCQCSKFFWTENSLKHHSSLCHSEKAFICEICGKGFRFRSNLAEHRSVHTSLKPYVCKYCGKSSRLKGNLTKHILKHHKQETNAVVGSEDIIVKKGKKSVKDPKAIDFLEKSMIVLTGSKLSESGKESARNGRSKMRSSPVFVPNPFLLAGEESRPHGRSDRRRATVQRSVEAIIESALASSRSDNDSLPVENCIPASALLESSMETSDFYESPASGESAELRKTPDFEELDTSSSAQITSNSTGTRCGLCGKHFRKKSQLDEHLSTKHSSPDQLDHFDSGVDLPKLSSSQSRTASGTSILHSAITPIARYQANPTKTGGKMDSQQNSFGGDGHLEEFPQDLTAGQKSSSNGADGDCRSLSDRIGNLASCQKDIQEIKALLVSFKQTGTTASGPKVDSLLLSLDTRVSRVERQMEATLNTLGSLVKMQTSMNAAFQQLRAEMGQKLQSLCDEVKSAGATNNGHS